MEGEKLLTLIEYLAFCGGTEVSFSKLDLDSNSGMLQPFLAMKRFELGNQHSSNVNEVSMECSMCIHYGDFMLAGSQRN